MFYFVLSLLFLAVFAYLAWRIIAAHLHRSSRPARPESYVCPVCNEIQCECHKEEDH